MQIPPTRLGSYNAQLSTGKSASGAGCKKNLSEVIAKEPGAATLAIVVTFLIIYKGSRFLWAVLS